MIGEVSAEISRFDEKGRSINVCDGLVSLTDADELTCATVQLWPTAYRFKRGHRIRVQFSSGAFPRFNRNPGTGEHRAQQVFHDAERPSAITLPHPTGGLTSPQLAEVAPFS